MFLVCHILLSHMTSYILRAFIYFRYDSTLQDLSEKFANAGKKNCLQSGKTHISQYLTTQQNEFTLFYDTVASLEQKLLTYASMVCLGSNQQHGAVLPTALFLSLFLCLLVHSVSRANGQNAHRLTGVRDTALERQSCYSAILLITPHRSLLALQWI